MKLRFRLSLVDERYTESGQCRNERTEPHDVDRLARHELRRYRPVINCDAFCRSQARKIQNPIDGEALVEFLAQKATGLLRLCAACVRGHTKLQEAGRSEIDHDQR